MADENKGVSRPGQGEPVDAVFVIGSGSVHGNEELRYALRNMDRHCPFVRNVYICGECPSWVDRSAVVHLPWPDRFSHAKDANIVDKLRHACSQPGIAERVLFCSDDQFQTRECSWGDFSPRFLRKFFIGDPWYDAKHRLWHRRLRKTLEREVERRKAEGLDVSDVYYYQPHIWMPMDRDKFLEYAAWSDYEHRDDTIIASGYFNFANVHGSKDHDHVFLGRSPPGPLNATHVAYNDGSYRAAMNILAEMFPGKSRFERGPAANRARPVAASAVRAEHIAPIDRRNAEAARASALRRRLGNGIIYPS